MEYIRGEEEIMQMQRKVKTRECSVCHKQKDLHKVFVCFDKSALLNRDVIECSECHADHFVTDSINRHEQERQILQNGQSL